MAQSNWQKFKRVIDGTFLNFCMIALRVTHQRGPSFAQELMALVKPWFGAWMGVTGRSHFIAGHTNRTLIPTIEPSKITRTLLRLVTGSWYFFFVGGGVWLFPGLFLTRESVDIEKQMGFPFIAARACMTERDHYFAGLISFTDFKGATIKDIRKPLFIASEAHTGSDLYRWDGIFRLKAELRTIFLMVCEQRRTLYKSRGIVRGGSNSTQVKTSCGCDEGRALPSLKGRNPILLGEVIFQPAMGSAR